MSRTSAGDDERRGGRGREARPAAARRKRVQHRDSRTGRSDAADRDNSGARKHQRDVMVIKPEIQRAAASFTRRTKDHQPQRERDIDTWRAGRRRRMEPRVMRRQVTCANELTSTSRLKAAAPIATRAFSNQACGVDVAPECRCRKASGE